MPHINSTQNEVIEFLRQPSSYSDISTVAKNQVTVIETHAAMIFLAGSDAYKIKKNVVFPYLDFGTLEKRKTACKRELSINQPHAPQIYLGVVAITREADGTLEINGAGIAVEWAVHMRRFDDNALLAHALEGQNLKPVFFDHLADEIIRYHIVAPEVVSSKGRAKMAAIVDQLCQAFKDTPDLLAAPDVEVFSELAHAQLSRAGDCLDYRSQHGFIRRCHGDLHLENIVVIENLPILFDAIEFNEEIATIDVLYDLSFLLMDLGRHSLDDIANQILNRYLARSQSDENYSGLKILPLFLGCRAAIRAMVISTRIHQSQGAETASDRCEVRDYFKAAQDYMQYERPQLIAVGGFSGTGKTTIARKLAPFIGRFPGAVHLRTDIERKAWFDVEDTTRLAPDSYTEKISEEIYERIFKKADDVLKAGKSVVIDAAFLKPDQRARTESIAHDLGLSFTGLWLNGDEDILIERVAARIGDASDATPDIVRRQLAHGAGVIDWHQVDASGLIDETLANVRLVVDA